MKLVFFGRLRDAVGVHEMTCSPPANVVDTDMLRRWIGAEHLALVEPVVRMAVDDRLVTGPEPIAGAAEIAFLPPVSGG